MNIGFCKTLNIQLLFSGTWIMNPIQKILLLLVIGLGSWVKMPAQTTSLPAHQASRRVSPIALDGKLDEQDWEVA